MTPSMQEPIPMHDPGSADGNRAPYLLIGLAVSLVLAWSLLAVTEIPQRVAPVSPVFQLDVYSFPSVELAVRSLERME